MSFTDLKIEGGKYLKIDAGKYVDIHILSTSPVVEYMHGFGKEKEPCAGDNCQMCEDGEKRIQRFFVNVFDRSDKKVKIFEFGPMVGGQIKAIAEMLEESDQTVHDIDLRVKKEVEGEKTSYMVMQKPLGGEIPSDLKLHKI